MTPFRSLIRPAPWIAACAAGGAMQRPRRARLPATLGGPGRRERAAAALVVGAQILLACGYALLTALVCSAVLGLGGVAPEPAAGPPNARPADLARTRP